MPEVLVLLMVLIFLGIYMLFKNDADKKGEKLNWLYVIYAYIPFGLFFGFMLLVALHGRTGF